MIPRAVSLLLFLSSACPGQSAPSAPPPVQTNAPSSQSPVHPAPASTNGRLYYFITQRSTLTREISNVPRSDEVRLARLRSAFADAGCSGNLMATQPVTGNRHTHSSNLICTWPADSPNTILVIAHYQHHGQGDGAVENFSGAILLPYLYLAIQARPRLNTWVFAECYGKSGVAAYVASLSREQKRQMRAVISLDGLGLTPVVRYFTPSPESDYLSAPVIHLQMALLLASLSGPRVPRPEPTNPLHWLPLDDTERFRFSHIPGIVLHSIPENRATLPGSSRDTAAAIDPNAYYLNYRAIAIYLVGLDSIAAKLATDDPIWHGNGAEFHLDFNDLPIKR
jgi:hypothetical protein